MFHKEYGCNIVKSSAEALWDHISLGKDGSHALKKIGRAARPFVLTAGLPGVLRFPQERHPKFHTNSSILYYKKAY